MPVGWASYARAGRMRAEPPVRAVVSSSATCEVLACGHVLPPPFIRVPGASVRRCWRCAIPLLPAHGPDHLARLPTQQELRRSRT